MTLTRNDLRALARVHLQAAHDLLGSGRHPAAYYLAGLAVECALKACIAGKTQRHTFPDKSTVNASWTHDLPQLLRTAGLEQELREDAGPRPVLERNWGVVKDWRNDSRYTHVGPQRARDLYHAVTARPDGVMSWIRRHW